MPKIFNTSSQAQPLCCLKVFSIHLFTHEYSVKITPLLFLFWTYYNTRCLRQSHLLSVTCLGVSIDQELTFADHIRSLECRCFFWIRRLRSVRRTLTSDTIIALVSALIISRLDYCNNILVGVYDIHLRQLQGVLNAAARLIARRRKFDSISSTIPDVLHWLPVRQHVDFKLSVLTVNCLRNLAPSCLMNMCQPVTGNLHRRRLRSAVHGDLIVPPMKTVGYGPRSFAVAGPSTWNALPAPLRNDELSTMSIRRQLKTELYIRAYYLH